MRPHAHLLSCHGLFLSSRTWNVFCLRHQSSVYFAQYYANQRKWMPMMLGYLIMTSHIFTPCFLTLSSLCPSLSPGSWVHPNPHGFSLLQLYMVHCLPGSTPTSWGRLTFMLTSIISTMSFPHLIYKRLDWLCYICVYVFMWVCVYMNVETRRWSQASCSVTLSLILGDSVCLWIVPLPALVLINCARLAGQSKVQESCVHWE